MGVARDAVGPDRTAVGFDQFLGDGQTYAGPASIPRPGTVGAKKAFEDEGQVVGGNGCSAVVEIDFDPVPHPAYGNDHPAAPGRVFAAVVEQILHSLEQLVPIGGDPRLVVLPAGRDRNPLFLEIFISSMKYLAASLSTASQTTRKITPITGRMLIRSSFQSRRFLMPSLFVRFGEPVAETADGEDPLRIGGIVLNLLPELADMDIDDPVDHRLAMFIEALKQFVP